MTLKVYLLDIVYEYECFIPMSSHAFGMLSIKIMMQTVDGSVVFVATDGIEKGQVM